MVRTSDRRCGGGRFDSYLDLKIRMKCFIDSEKYLIVEKNRAPPWCGQHSAHEYNDVTREMWPKKLSTAVTSPGINGCVHA